MRMSRSLVSLACASLVLVAHPAAAGTDDWATASDIVRDGLVLAALGAPVVQGDWQGLKQSGLSLAVTGGTSYALKQTIHETRPDGSNDESFPSGHTSISFASAATLQNRYGWKVGVPAHLAAAFVGVARVEADKHYWHDVVAGAAIGEAAGQLLTTRANDRVHVMPWGSAHGGGVAVAAVF